MPPPPPPPPLPAKNDHKRFCQYISEELNNENGKAVIKIYELVAITKYSHNRPTSNHSLLINLIKI
jgi:hypothetical protein